MNFKTTVILALILAIGVAGVVLLNKQDAKIEEQKKFESKLLNIDNGQISELILEPSGIHVVKDSNDWKIVSPIKTDADNEQLNPIANMFNWAKIDRIVSSDPSEYTDFGLEPAKGKLIVLHENDSDTLLLGDDSPTGSFVFARKSDSPDVFLTTTTLKTNINKDVFDLRDKRVLAFEKSQVRKIELKSNNNRFSIEKNGNNWALVSPIEYQSDNSKVNQMIDKLGAEKAKQYVNEEPKSLEEYGLLKPSYKIDLSLGSEMARKMLLIGSRNDDTYFAKDDSRDPVFLVDSSFVHSLKVTLFDLRKKELADFSSYEVDKFIVERTDSTFVAEKDTSGVWQITEPIKVKANSAEIASINSTVSSLKVERFVSDSPASLKAYGLDNPHSRGRFYKGETLLIDLLVGKKNKNDQVYVKRADKKNVFLVNQDIFSKLTSTLKNISDIPGAENIN